MIEPYNTGFIYATTAAGTVHEIYYEQCGNPQVLARRCPAHSAQPASRRPPPTLLCI